ncbi:hypothetical protein N7537_006941, partial [Penicillium hordei]
IVAVHGLGGHLFRTWTHESQCCWLRDLLPVDIPDARIMTFGYDANVIGSSMNTFKDSAQLLLQHLLLKRDPEQALVKASSSPVYKAIRASIIGTIFMGTPHRGSSVASLGKVVANAAKLCSIGISVSHLNSLLPDSRELSELSTEFGQNIFSPPVKVINFFESKKTKIGLMRTPIVPHSSAIMDPIGPIQEGISLDGDHRQICQFSSGDDSQYQLVLRNIQSILAPGSDGLSSQVDNPKVKQVCIISKAYCHGCNIVQSLGYSRSKGRVDGSLTVCPSGIYEQVMGIKCSGFMVHQVSSSIS